MGTKPVSSWSTRFGWFHYSLDDVYSFTDEDFESVAKKYKDAGINAVILFGAHFRFSFWAYWDDIVIFIKRITEACHRHGIILIEHHSSHLTYNPPDPDAWKNKVAFSAVGEDHYEDFVRTSQQNPAFDGAHLDDFAQIDGSTGKMALSSYIHTEGKDMDWIFKHYNGNAHCFNHPGYVNAYKKHLKDIIEIGKVDGMMNDDVQWYGGNTGCGCEYCRSAFLAATGYDLPYPEDWEGFFENYQDKSYIAWKRFKKQSSGEFHKMLDDFYKDLGFDPVRPAYCAEVLPFDTTCYGFEPAAELWDYIFQECCGIIKYSYVCFAGEAIHRYAMAKRYGVPPMALLYPQTKDSAYAAWALCRSWGQMYTGTGGLGSALHDKPFRDFEKAYSRYLDDPSKQADISFYFSELTRDHTHKDAPKIYQKPLMSYLESAYVKGLTCDMTFREDTPEIMKDAPAIAVVYISMISDHEIHKLRTYAEEGGRLIIIGKFAETDDEANPRPASQGLELLGLSSRLIPQGYEGNETLSFEGKSRVFDKAKSEFVIEVTEGEDIKVIARGDNDEPLAVCERVGKGDIILHPGDISDNPIQAAIWPRGDTPVDASVLPDMRANNGELLNLLLKGRTLEIDNEEIIPTIYTSKDGSATTIHLVNTAGMLPETDSIGTTKDPIPSFTDGAPTLPEFTVTVNNYDKHINFVWLLSPEFAGSKPVTYERQDNILKLTIPGDTFSGYGLVVIE